MTWPEDKTQPQPNMPAQGPKPQRLWMLTVPLMVGLFYNAISLLTLPFSGNTLNTMLAQMSRDMGTPGLQLAPEQIQLVLWISFFITALLILWLYFTRRAVLEGRSWGRVSSLLIGVLSLLIFPFGTVLGVIMLIGAFDRGVTNYLTR